MKYFVLLSAYKNVFFINPWVSMHNSFKQNGKQVRDDKYLNAFKFKTLITKVMTNLGSKVFMPSGPSKCFSVSSRASHALLGVNISGAWKHGNQFPFWRIVNVYQQYHDRKLLFFCHVGDMKLVKMAIGFE